MFFVKRIGYVFKSSSRKGGFPLWRHFYVRVYTYILRVLVE